MSVYVTNGKQKDRCSDLRQPRLCEEARSADVAIRISISQEDMQHATKEGRIATPFFGMVRNDVLLL